MIAPPPTPTPWYVQPSAAPGIQTAQLPTHKKPLVGESGSVPWWMTFAALLILFAFLLASAIFVIIKIKIISKKHQLGKELEKTTRVNNKAIIELLTVSELEITERPASPTSENVRQRRNSLSPPQDSSTVRVKETKALPQGARSPVRTPPRLADEGVTEHVEVLYDVPGDYGNKRRSAADKRMSPEVKQYRSRPPKGIKDRTPGKTLRKVKSDPYHIREPLYLGPIELKKAAREAKSPKPCSGQPVVKSPMPCVGKPLVKARSAPLIGSRLMTPVRELPQLEDHVVYDTPVTPRSKGEDVDDPLRNGFKGEKTRRVKETPQHTTGIPSKLSGDGKTQDGARSASSKSFANPFYDSFDTCLSDQRDQANPEKSLHSLYGPGEAQVLEKRPVYMENGDSIYDMPSGTDNDREILEEHFYDQVVPPVPPPLEDERKRTKRRRRSSSRKRGGKSKEDKGMVQYTKVQKNRKGSARKEEDAVYDDPSVLSGVAAQEGADTEGNLYDCVAEAEPNERMSRATHRPLPRIKLKTHTRNHPHDMGHMEYDGGDMYEEINETRA